MINSNVNYLPVISDNKFSHHFRNLRQVFLCITNDCNLRCAHCLYKPWLRKGDDIDFNLAISLMNYFRTLGAFKISFLGGEPTIYGKGSSGFTLVDFVAIAKKLNYSYIRVVTNGQFDSELLYNDTFKCINEITYSFDAPDEESHDMLRGSGAFSKALSNMKLSIARGYKVDVTVCIHKHLISGHHDKIQPINNMIDWASSLGVNRINFHPVIEMGVERDSWVNQSYIQPEEWVPIYQSIRNNINDHKYNIAIRLPQRYVERAIFQEDSKYYGYCPVKLGERVELHPNGVIQVCALLKGTPYSIARFHKDNENVILKWTEDNNEIASYKFKFNKEHPCAIIKKSLPNYAPLCISFKPFQDEIIWNALKMQ